MPQPTKLLLSACLPLLLLVARTSGATKPPPPAPDRPNVIFILADDLGYGDLGCYGQKKIKTPHLDRMAAEGTRFTQAYCGTSVCAPSRCVLLTGLHTGHAHIRANREIKPEGQEPLPAGTLTVARLFQQAGYKTACTGKWGLGFPGSPGEPTRQGFDYFFGYNCQRRAHEYYPDHLYRNDRRVELDGKTYSHDLIVEDTLGWVRQNGGAPFFLYLALTTPHGKFQVPDLGPYAGEPWKDVEKKYAAMVTRMDRDVGRLMALLAELKIDDRTLVFFASDNGPTPQFVPTFDSNGPHRGIKRDLYEGGLRVPMIARWPGKVPAGRVSDGPWAFYDFLPTVAELTGAKLPAGFKPDGLSVLPALLGGETPRREFFYWELHEGTSKQAVRMGDWKAVRPAPSRPVELYDLKADSAEARDVSAGHPDVLKKVTDLMNAAHVETPLWPTKEGPRPGTNTAREE